MSATKRRYIGYLFDQIGTASRGRARRVAGMAVLLVFAMLGAAFAKDTAVPGQLVVQEPTLICLGFEWHIQGDDNENCRVEVAYREAGSENWREALPLFRAENKPYHNFYPPDKDGNCKRYWGKSLDNLSWGNKLAGSIFDLKPATEYEVRFHLKDPDGGEETRTVRARTRPVPVAYKDGRTLHVIPGNGGGNGTEKDPFRGFKAADEASLPGDIVLLHEGLYPGPLVVTKDGESGKPIVWRGVNEAKVIIDGGGAALAYEKGPAVVDLRRRNFVHLEHVTVSNGMWGVRLECGNDLVVRRCIIDNCDIGVAAWATQAYGRRFLICDNIIRGRKTWDLGVGPSAGTNVIGNEGIVPTGEGHVLCHNRIEGFSDGISFGDEHNEHINEDGSRGMTSCSLDVYGNEIVTCLDDGIETDDGWSNVRVFRNRITNTLMGFSCQPTFGGPVYFIRNACYNVNSFLKFNCEPSGMVIFHNTAFANIGWAGGGWHNAIMRNTIIASARYACIQTAGDKADFDYNGYLPSPMFGTMFMFMKGGKTLADFRANTGMEQHGVQLRLAEADVLLPDFANALLPSFLQNKKSAYRPGAVALDLSPKSRAVDAGVRLANVNDDFTGKAPDMGCYELNQPVPRYGPRPVSADAP